ncbi:granulocyte colony-stimulating factor-like [Anabas testudineus]|uniref:Granulocyte colony-stimulating factor n=1 Tax=Anabas testudineus TaxID=64144 RepID=A0A3Q1JZR1_ANATE|nr:granulocyte colony-stimulating factor-like [Anabas testudineus]XP_026210835.1 granulocyte colony-stimulating factor-like [Anabas testudineus]
MDTKTVVALLRCFLLTTLVQSAPTPPLTFKEAIEQTKMVVEKILTGLPAVHAATINIQGWTLDSPTNLQTMEDSLRIPNPPVIKPLSEGFTLETCVGHMLAGIQLYQGLVGVLSDKLSGLSDLKADLRDLLLRINKMEEVGQLSGTSGSDQNSASDLASRLPGNYEVQVAVHLTLSRLQSFCHDMMRSLRNIATYRTQPSGGR